MGKVLIIDDENEIRKLVARFLKKLGFDSDEAENGILGLELFKQNQYEFVVTDIIMPEKEGLETIRDMRKINQNAKILGISGGSLKWNFDYLKTARLLGAQVTLNKPFDFDEFSDSVKKLISIETEDCDV